MVMTLKYHVDAQILEDGDKGFAAAEDVAVLGMAGHGVDGVVEGNDLPIHVGVGGNGSLHKGLVLSRRLVVGIEHHEQHIVVNEPVVAAGIGGAVLTGLVGNVEVLAVGVGIGIVVADDGGHGQVLQRLVLQIAVILALTVGGIDLVARGEHKGDIGEIVVGGNELQGVVPAGSISVGAAAGADLGVAHIGKGEGTAVIGGKETDFRRNLTIDGLISVLNACLQTGSGCLVGILAVVIAFGGGGVGSGGLRHGAIHQFAGLCHPQLTRSVGIDVPGKVHLGLVSAHGQADVGQGDRLYIHFVPEFQRRNIKVDVGTALVALMHFRSHNILAIVQQGERPLIRKIKRLFYGIVTTILHVGGNVLIVETCYLGAVDIQGNRIIAKNLAQDLLDLGSILDHDLSTEKECFNIGGTVLFVLSEQSVGHIAVNRGQLTALGAERTLSGLPCAAIIVGSGPAGALIAFCGSTAGGIGAVVQIGPDSILVDLGGIVGEFQRRLILIPELQRRHIEIDVGAACAILMDLHSDGVHTVLQQLQHFFISDADHLGSRVVLMAGLGSILQVFGDLIVAPAGHLGAVDVEGGGVVMDQTAFDGLDSGSVLHIHIGAEEECFNIGGAVLLILGQQGVGDVSAAQGSNLASLGAERTRSGLPCAVIIVGSSPAGTIIAFCGSIAGGIGTVIQIGPLCSGIDRRFVRDTIIV